MPLVFFLAACFIKSQRILLIIGSLEYTEGNNNSAVSASSKTIRETYQRIESTENRCRWRVLKYEG